MSADHGHGEKESATKKAFKFFGTMLGVVIAVILILMLAGVSIDIIGGLAETFFNGLIKFASMTKAKIFEFSKVIIGPLIFVLVVWYLVNDHKKKSGGGHDDHGHGH